MANNFIVRLRRLYDYGSVSILIILFCVEVDNDSSLDYSLATKKMPVLLKRVLDTAVKIINYVNI